MGKLTQKILPIEGKSNSYSFNLYSPDSDDLPEKEGGIYIYAYILNILNTPKIIKNIYCGKTSSLKNRLENHHKKECIERNNPNVLLIHFENDEKERTKIELDLLNAINFSCNEQNN